MAHCTCNRAAVCDYTVVLLHGTGHLPFILTPECVIIILIEYWLRIYDISLYITGVELLIFKKNPRPFNHIEV